MKHLCCILLLLWTTGCEILEEDISRNEVRILAPADRVTVQAGAVDFRWQASEHTAGYEFSVVSPSFASAARVVIDTVIYADSLDRRFGCRQQLAEGEYQWSVNGFNSGYSTRREVRSLTVLPPEENDNRPDSLRL